MSKHGRVRKIDGGMSRWIGRVVGTDGALVAGTVDAVAWQEHAVHADWIGGYCAAGAAHLLLLEAR